MTMNYLNKLCQEAIETNGNLAELCKAKLLSKYKDFLPKTIPVENDVYQIFALLFSAGFSNHELDIDLIVKKYDIKTLEIKNSALYRSLLYKGQQTAVFIYSILCSKNTDAIKELFQKMPFACQALQETIDMLLVFQTMKFNNEISETEFNIDNFVFFKDSKDLSELQLSEVLLISLVLAYSYAYDLKLNNGVISRVLQMVIENDRNYVPIFAIGTEHPEVPDTFDKMIVYVTCLFAKNISNCHTGEKYHELALEKSKISLFTNCDTNLLLSNLLSTIDLELRANVIMDAVRKTAMLYPGRFIRYKESEHAAEFINTCVFTNLLLTLLMDHKEKLGDYVHYLEKQHEKTKMLLAKERKTEKNVEKQIDEYKLRAVTAEASFKEKEDTLLTRIHELELTNAKLTHENKLLQAGFVDSSNVSKDFVEPIISENDEPILPTHEAMVDELINLPIVVIGGHDNWQSKMKQIYPNWTYIRANTSDRSDVYKNAKIVIFHTEYMGHGMFYQAMKNISDDTLVIYVHKSNVKSCTADIYEQYIISNKTSLSE